MCGRCPSLSILSRMRSVTESAARGRSFAIHAYIRSRSSYARLADNNPHARRSAKRSRTSSSVRNFGFWISEPAPDFRHLLVGEPQRALVLLFHEGHDLRDIRLPLRRPGQDAVEDGFDLILGHGSHYTTSTPSRHANSIRIPLVGLTGKAIGKAGPVNRSMRSAVGSIGRGTVQKVATIRNDVGRKRLPRATDCYLDLRAHALCGRRRSCSRAAASSAAFRDGRLDTSHIVSHPTSGNKA